MSNPQSVAAANALSGERSFVQVQYPITGDPQLDLISGCLAVLDGGNGPANLNTTGKICVLKYLLDRFTKNLEFEIKAEEEQRRFIGPQGIGQGRSPTPMPVCPPPFPTHPQPYITSGSLPPQANIANDHDYREKLNSMTAGILFSSDK